MGHRSPLGGVMFVGARMGDKPAMVSRYVDFVNRLSEVSHVCCFVLLGQTLPYLGAVRKNAQWCNLNSIVPKDGGGGICVVGG